MTDPFSHDSYLSDHDVENEDLGRERWRPPHGASPAAPARASAKTTRGDGESHSTDSSNLGGYTVPADTMTEAKSNVLVQSLLSPHAGSHTHTASSSSTDLSRQSTHTGAAGRPTVERTMADMDKEPQVLSRSSGNKEKRPPPPPRSHHGKLINPNPATTSTLSRQISPNFTNHPSSYGSSTESSFSHQMDTSSHAGKYRQSSVDSSNVLGENRPAPLTELRRSQSQYKRPPTPPLSRRQSQMRRSKSTQSKTSPTQVGVASGNREADPSPGIDRESIASLQRESGFSTPQSEATSRSNPTYSDSVSGTRPSTTETPTPVPLSRMDSMRSTKRMTYTNSPSPSAVPPPPPPRRTRVSSSNSGDGKRLSAFPPEKSDKPDEDFIPRPSNANDILADLSRLQKEVDDLRGHYQDSKTGQ